MVVVAAERIRHAGDADRLVIRFAIGAGEHVAGELRHGIHAQPVERLVFARRHVVLMAVDVIAGNGHQRFDSAALAAGFEQVEGAQDVRLIGPHGIVVRRLHARLAGQVDDHGRLHAVEQSRGRLPVAHVGRVILMGDFELLGRGKVQNVQFGLGRPERASDPAADEARSAGDQHPLSPPKIQVHRVHLSLDRLSAGWEERRRRLAVCFEFVSHAPRARHGRLKRVAQPQTAGRDLLLGIDVFHTVAHGGFDAADIFDQAAQALRLDRSGLIASPTCPVERDVPLDETGAQGHGGHGRDQADFVP